MKFELYSNKYVLSMFRRELTFCSSYQVEIIRDTAYLEVRRIGMAFIFFQRDSTRFHGTCKFVANF